MSVRLGRALAEHIRGMAGASTFVLLEGVPLDTARGMADAWGPDLPKLAVGSGSPAAFGAYALRGDESGTGLRNANPGGVVLVLTQGARTPDRSSLGGFEALLPSQLLETPEGFARLAEQKPAVLLDGVARAVKEAVINTDAALRPAASAVADYFDRVGDGEPALVALPALGAFRDEAAAGQRIESGRIFDNLALARLVLSDEVARPSEYAELRRRAADVLRARSAANPGAAAAAAARVVTLLQAGDSGLLTHLAFDEARAIFQQRKQDVAEQAAAEIASYRSQVTKGSQADRLPWDEYGEDAKSLGGGGGQREAARSLCSFDDGLQHKLFTRDTRRKLERLFRDKSVNGSRPSCPEAALAVAAQQIGGVIQGVRVTAPRLPPPNNRVSRSGARAMLTIACARLRLGALMQKWASEEGGVDALLLGGVRGGDLPLLLDCFADADLSATDRLPALQLRLYEQPGFAGQTVLVDWAPDLDDLALLRAALLFAEQPSLTLTMVGPPTLAAFCQVDTPAAVLPVPHTLAPLARSLQKLAGTLLDHGMSPPPMQAWVDRWTEQCRSLQERGDAAAIDELALAGAVTDASSQSTALSGLSPLKAEWLAQYQKALWTLLARSERTDVDGYPVAETARAIGRLTASQHPAHLRRRDRDDALLPAREGRVWGLYGPGAGHDESGHSADALADVLGRLLKLQPEAAGHLRCLAWGAGAADLLADMALQVIGTKAGGPAEVRKVEVFCIGRRDRPGWDTLVRADDKLRDSRDVLELRYLDTLDDAEKLLATGRRDYPAVHLALVTGLTDGGRRLQSFDNEVEPPDTDPEVLFAPRVWQRPRRERRTLLMPPTASPAGQAWLRLQTAYESGWNANTEPLRVPEIMAGTSDVAPALRRIHDLALWVATLDRYTTRDSLERALGADRVAILHQERRLGGDSPLSLVLSQKSGGPADSAIGRSLRAAGIIADRDEARTIGTELRRVASQGYGILALQAATSGAGINELVGHVVAFSLLATRTTPWPLPPGCRVLLVSLDEYRHWFSGSKRADLLAIALDTREGGVHVAAIEVKARRSDETVAAASALDQLRQTLSATRWAASPKPDSIYSRMWLNRIAEAAYSVARESKFRLDEDEIGALEAFRRGRGTLEWAGVGLVFGPELTDSTEHLPEELGVDIVPIALHQIRLTEALLRTATGVKLTELRTVDAEARPLSGGRVRRRPESKTSGPGSGGDNRDTTPPAGDDAQDPEPEDKVQELSGTDTPVQQPDPDREFGPQAREDTRTTGHRPPPPPERPFQPPLLGWDVDTREPVYWHPTGPVLQNGHTEIWGSSGMGKTQFVMSLLAQLSRHSGSYFGIADFKNDYSNATGFPAFAGAEYLDLWNDGAPYNPLRLDDAPNMERAIDAAVIEIRDTIEEATRSFSRMGVRQKAKLLQALESTYSVWKSERRWPTLHTLNDRLDPDLAGILGDLTRHDLFRDGPPLGDVIDRNVVFDLSTIPGNGQTTVLAAGFILSSLLMRVQNLPPIPNSLRYLAVVDEAHRVADFRAVETMIREGRSKGLAVILATQQPLDLEQAVGSNTQTRICFGLPDAGVARDAAKKLQPENSRLAGQIRSLGVGEAFVRIAGEPPRLLKMAQAHRDADELGLPALVRQG